MHPLQAKAIAAFQKDPPTTVFLLSMRSGAVGINLTSASHVFLMEVRRLRVLARANACL